MIEFKEFEKISRLNREVIVTEKLDGTNGQVNIRIVTDGDAYESGVDTLVGVMDIRYAIRAGSRSRWVSNVGGKADDNYGFGRWVAEHAGELALLGVGSHYGEWWGQGIQRKYNMVEKRWSLFNAGRWRNPGDSTAPETTSVAPLCCHVVPIIATGTGFGVVYESVAKLAMQGSLASPGFMKPEGVVAYHTHSRTLFKMTIERDTEHKFERVSRADG